MSEHWGPTTLKSAASGRPHCLMVVKVLVFFSGLTQFPLVSSQRSTEDDVYEHPIPNGSHYLCFKGMNDVSAVTTRSVNSYYRAMLTTRLWELITEK